MRTSSTLALLACLMAAQGLQAQKSGGGQPNRSLPPPPSSRVNIPAPQPHSDPGLGVRDPQIHQTPRQDIAPKGIAPSIRPRSLPPPAQLRVLPPRPTPRCVNWPDEVYWRSRDITKEIQAMARQGFIPVLPGGLAPEITGSTYYPAGWIAYGFVVPAKEKLHVILSHPNRGWFRLAMVDRWGQLREGMLHNLIPIGNPEVSFDNPLKEATTVYVIVDDPGWMSTPQNPFTLKVDRSWDPAKTQAPALPPVLGIWAQSKPVEEKPEKPS